MLTIHIQTITNLLLTSPCSGNLKLAQKFLGHSTIEMTADIYTHTSAEAERESAVALERAIYGHLFPVVPNFANRNNSAALN